MRRFGLIKSWQKIGGQTELAKRFGKSLYIQNFINHRGENVEWVFFKVQDFSMIMPVTENLEVVTVVQYRHGPDRISHELPAGMLESGTEEFSELALRELEEETGYKVGEVIKLASLPIHVQSSPTFCHLFLAINCKRVGQVHTDANEEIKVKSSSSLNL